MSVFLCLFALGYEKQTGDVGYKCLHGRTGYFFSYFLSSPSKLQCAECTWSITTICRWLGEYKLCLNTLSDYYKICSLPMPEEISIPFSYGNALMYFLLLLEN